MHCIYNRNILLGLHKTRAQRTEVHGRRLASNSQHAKKEPQPVVQLVLTTYIVVHSVKNVDLIHCFNLTTSQIEASCLHS